LIEIKMVGGNVSFLKRIDTRLGGRGKVPHELTASVPPGSPPPKDAMRVGATRANYLVAVLRNGGMMAQALPFPEEL
jgi:hypothetical protein